MARLSRVVFLLRDLEHGVRFYRDGLGLKVETTSSSFARLSTRDGFPIELNSAENEAQCSTGYSPFLTFEIEDMDKTIPRLVQLGAALDGAIRYEAYGKVAAIRSPDGHMLGLYEKANLPNDGDIALAAAAAARTHLGNDADQTQ